MEKAINRLTDKLISSTSFTEGVLLSSYLSFICHYGEVSNTYLRNITEAFIDVFDRFGIDTTELKTIYYHLL